MEYHELTFTLAGETGYRVDGDDLDDITTALAQILSDEALAKCLGAQGVESGSVRIRLGAGR